MSLRDLFLFGILAFVVVRAPRSPSIGALAWVVFGVMAPHRLAWGAAYGFPFSMVIALATLAGVALTKEPRQVKGGAALGVLLVFLGWMCVTTLFAFEPDKATAYLSRVTKTFVMTAAVLLVLHTRRQVNLLVWALVGSLGFYGVKGGIFTILNGGQFMVNGPDDSVIAGNNALAVGLVSTIPLMVYLRGQTASKWVRRGLVVAAGLCAISVLGSYSRGALLAILAMGALLWLRGPQKIMTLGAIVLFVAVAIPAMPDSWTKRMNTIETYEEDGSAVNRLVAWETAYRIAVDRFPLAGGLEWESPRASLRYSPVPTMTLVAHSIYFEVIGSQGFIGLGMYLLFWWLVWRQCAWLRQRCRRAAELQWAHSLASMTQVSLVGYAVGGAFLNLAFWEMPYYLFAAIGTAKYVVEQHLAATAKAAHGAPDAKSATAATAAGAGDDRLPAGRTA